MGDEGVDMTKGWAVKCEGKIDVKTVSPERRAAAVNWLDINVMPILRGYEDKLIWQIWDAAAKNSDAKLIEVEIREIA
jgi:hypothetical protein